MTKRALFLLGVSLAASVLNMDAFASPGATKEQPDVVNGDGLNAEDDAFWASKSVENPKHDEIFNPDGTFRYNDSDEAIPKIKMRKLN